MSRQREPMRVVPLPFAVPRWTVTPSRNTLSSPIDEVRRLAGPGFVLRDGAQRRVRKDAIAPADRARTRAPSPARRAPFLRRASTPTPTYESGPTTTPSARRASGFDHRRRVNANRRRHGSFVTRRDRRSTRGARPGRRACRRRWPRRGASRRWSGGARPRRTGRAGRPA